MDLAALSRLLSPLDTSPLQDRTFIVIITMRLSTIIVSLALAVSLAIAGPAAGPTTTTDPSTTPTPTAEVVEGATQPNFDEAPAPSGTPTNGKGEKGDAVVVGAVGNTTSKREDFNPLNERAYALLILCPYRDCKGYCRGYNLNYYWGRCYPNRYRYYSAYIYSYGGFDHGVYAGYCYYYNCYGMAAPEILSAPSNTISICRSVQGALLRRVRKCYNIYPYIDCWFKKW